MTPVPNGDLAVLAGGVGAARFLRGLIAVVPPERVAVIVNTADDATFYGLRVCPDVDTNLYALGGEANAGTGWGLQGDTFHALEQLRRYGHDTWFQLGDRDLATHIHRTWRLGQGYTLSEVTQELADKWGIRARLLPMSDERVATVLTTPSGRLPFQTYFVRRGARDRVREVTYTGAERAHPAPGVLEALHAARAVVMPPSNPVLSIDPILAVPGVREAVTGTAAPVVAVSPIIGGRAVKGPADRLLRDLGYEASALGVARYYGGLLDGLLLDERDRDLADAVAALGIRVALADTMLDAPARRREVARRTLELAHALAGQGDGS